MNLGRHELGSWIRVPCLTTNASGTPTQPHVTGDNPPIAAIYRGATFIESFQLYGADWIAATGVFERWVQLTSSYSAGQHTISVTWSVSSGGFYGSDLHDFEVIAGGSASGSVVAMQELQRPNGTFLIGEYDIGTLWQGRNPY